MNRKWMPKNILYSSSESNVRYTAAAVLYFQYVKVHVSVVFIITDRTVVGKYYRQEGKTR